jgi:hypothetical protein
MWELALGWPPFSVLLYDTAGECGLIQKLEKELGSISFYRQFADATARLSQTYDVLGTDGNPTSDLWIS